MPTTAHTPLPQQWLRRNISVNLKSKHKLKNQ